MFGVEKLIQVVDSLSHMIVLVGPAKSVISALSITSSVNHRQLIAFKTAKPRRHVGEQSRWVNGAIAQNVYVIVLTKQGLLVVPLVRIDKLDRTQRSRVVLDSRK